MATGASATVSWSGIASPTATDWIGLNPPGAPNSPILTWRYTTGASSGTVPFTIPSSIGLGSYQFRLFTNNTNNLIGISDLFTVAYPPKTISGTITKNGAPLSGVALSGTGATCLASDVAGQYSCTVAHGWSGTITPSSGTFAFSPASRSYTNVTANQSAQDYAVALVTITGTITSGGSPLAGVSFSAPTGEGCTVSNGSGQYTCTVAQNWSGTVTPGFGMYVFSPASRSYSSITSNQTSQDYAATPPVSISGTVMISGGAPFAGATFSASGGICPQSNAAGQYSCQVPSGWSGTVTPSQTGRTFTPASLSYSAITTNQTAQDYLAAGTTASANIFYIQPDHLNTPRVVFDDQQRLRWKWEQDEPFGLNAPDENPSSLGVLEMPLRFPGQRQDVETGLAYNYFRDYDSSIGRYAQSDPLSLGGGLNTFAYAAAAPLGYVDPDGLMKLPNDPSGLPSGWTPDPSHRDPNGERWVHPSGDYVDFNRGRPGLPGWRGKDHWHHNGGKQHLPPGTEVPDPPGDTQCPADNCQSKIATVVIGAAGAYILYRCVRMIPSLVPPLWWTIPPNLATP